MMSGLLSGKMTRERIDNFPEDDWRQRNEEFQEPRLSRNLKLASLLQEIGYPYNRTTAEVAIAWTLRHRAVTGAIVGGRHREQVEEVVGADEFRQSERGLGQVEKFLQESPQGRYNGGMGRGVCER